LEENMLEVDCPCVTPEVVLKASGHIEKFTDLMVKDEKTGTCYRADHLLKDFCKEKLEDLTLPQEKADESWSVFLPFWMISQQKSSVPRLRNVTLLPLTHLLALLTLTLGMKNNMNWVVMLLCVNWLKMFLVSNRYMRPESAQRFFVNFMDLYFYNGQKLPFCSSSNRASF
jgi:glycyl-tRNA synthetase